MSVSPSSHKRKAWDLNPHLREVARISSAARQTVSGYLPKLPLVDRPGIEPGFPPRQGGVFPLDDQPDLSAQWTAGSRTHLGAPTRARVSRPHGHGMPARAVCREVRPGIEPGHVLRPPYHSGVRPTTLTDQLLK